MVKNSQDIPTCMVSFRVFGVDLEPNKLTEILQITPDAAYAKGDLRRNNPKYTLHAHGMWILKSRVPDEEPLAAHLESLLAILTPKHDKIIQLSGLHNVDFYCALFSQNAFQIPPHILKEIGNTGATLGVVVYPPDEEVEQDGQGENS